MTTNVDEKTVAGFDDEWRRFDQRGVAKEELEAVFEQYFGIFPWERLPPSAVGGDFGCGSGRWAAQVAPRVGHLHLVDAAGGALDVAREKLFGRTNCSFYETTLDAVPLPDFSLDFGYSLGVLHHIPDTQAALASCVRKLKPGAPFLVYLYYRFDNRPPWYGALWKLSELGRTIVSRLPHAARHLASDVLATAVYWPLARGARLLERTGLDVEKFPLSYYRRRSFYVMRNDALDRFGTRLEQRFTRAEIERMMTAAGLVDIRFSDGMPFWCAVGIRATR